MLFDSNVGRGMAFLSLWYLQVLMNVTYRTTALCNLQPIPWYAVQQLVFLNLQTKHFDHNTVALICGIEAVQEAFGL